MSEQRPQSDPDDMASSGAPAERFSLNGTYSDAAVGIAEAAEAPETVAVVDDLTAPAAESAAAEPVAEPPAEPVAEPPAEPAPDDGATFLAELARAMQTTVELERTRVAEDADRRREAHLAAIQARRDTEAATMRELAADDLKAIDEWAESERQRIDAERERRAAALQEDLEISLTEHGAKIDSEVEGVEAAIAGYRTEVDGFFAMLGEATDPVEIARHASRRPVFPDLDAIGAIEAEPEQPAVGVMDPEAEADPAVAWSHWNETTAELAPAAPAEPAEPAETAAPAAEAETPALESEPVAVAAPSTDQPASGGLLQSVPVHRPFSWLRGERQEEDQ